MGFPPYPPEIAYLIEKSRLPANAYADLKNALADPDHVLKEAPSRLRSLTLCGTFPARRCRACRVASWPAQPLISVCPFSVATAAFAAPMFRRSGTDLLAGITTVRL